MCTTREAYDRIDPTQRLADYLNRHLPGCTIMPADLELLIEQHWGTVSGLAHRVHDRVVRKQVDALRSSC